MLRALYAEYAAPLLVYVLRLTGGDRGRAEDVVQETLLRAWRQPDVLDERRGSIRAWLFTVAHNVAIDAYRVRRRRPAEIGDAALTLLPVEDPIEQILDRSLIIDAMSVLSPQQRDVIIETYYRGRSVAETAHALGIPPGTVKSRSFYALRALRVALEERGISD